jgi:site-specific DNA-methyltransferase (adenine-specific)
MTSKPTAGSHLSVETWPIDRVTPYAKNPRKNERAVAAVEASLREYGWRQPLVVDRDGVLVVGHTRLKAARNIGMTEVPVHVATDLTPAQAKAYRIMDNKSGENAKWDMALLETEFQDLKDAEFDISLTGFSERELQEDDGAGGKDRQIADDQALKLQAKWGTALGQLWRIGPHRILCGSATDPAAWKRLMAGERAVLCNTDPPYGVSYKGTRDKKWDMIQADNKRDDNLLATLLVPALRLAGLHTEPDAAFYIWHAAATRRDFETALDTVGLEEKQYIVWTKDNFQMGWADYHWQQEPAFYCQKAGESARWLGDRTQTTVWKIRPPAPAEMACTVANGIRVSDGNGHGLYIGAKAPGGRKTRLVRIGTGESLTIAAEFTSDAWEITRDPANERLHPTQKPVRLFTIPILNHTKPGDLIVDPFSGSGAQFVAANEAGRRCYGMDLDPRYVACALERLAQAGHTPELEAK